MTFSSSAATNRIFVSNEYGNSISVIDVETHELIETIVIGTRPRGIGLSPDRSEIYVAVSAENRIAVIDTQTLIVKRSFKCGDDPEAFADNPDHLAKVNSNSYQLNASDFLLSEGESYSWKVIAIDDEYLN